MGWLFGNGPKKQPAYVEGPRGKVKVQRVSSGGSKCRHGKKGPCTACQREAREMRRVPKKRRPGGPMQTWETSKGHPLTNPLKPWQIFGKEKDHGERGDEFEDFE